MRIVDVQRREKPAPMARALYLLSMGRPVPDRIVAGLVVTIELDVAERRMAPRELHERALRLVKGRAEAHELVNGPSRAMARGDRPWPARVLVEIE